MVDVEYYEQRAKDIDEQIQNCFEVLNQSQFDCMSEEYSNTISRLQELQKLEESNAKVLLAAESNVLKLQEIGAKEVADDEKHKVELTELQQHDRELDIRLLELQTRRDELKLHERELEIKAASDERKHQVEQQAVLGRLGGEGLKFAGVLIGAVSSILCINAVLEYEHEEDGGIFPQKFMNQVFRF